MTISAEPIGPAYRIVTPRLVIRCYNPCDAPLLEDAVQSSIENLRPWMPWVESEPEALQIKVERLRHFRANFDLGVDFIYGIFNADETRLLGGTGLHTRVGPQAREIGYWVRTDSLHQGIATEGTAALTRVAFEVDRVCRVELHIDPNNWRSAAVPKKLGFQHEGTLRQRLQRSEKPWADEMVWTLLAGEYPTSPAASAALQAYNAINERLL